MHECKGMKIQEKFDFLRTKLIEISHCPDNKRYILDRYFKNEFKQRWIVASRKEKTFFVYIYIYINDLHHLYSCKSLVQKLHINKGDQQNSLKI